MNSENKNALQQYLEHMVLMRKGGFSDVPQRPLPEGFNYYCVDELILEAGSFSSPEELTEEQQEYVGRFVKAVNPQKRGCFKNAQRLVSMEGGNRIKYHEGFGAFHFPIHHAWNTIDGKVIDVTWSLLDDYADDIVYAGVPFPLQYIYHKQIETESYSSMLFDEIGNGAEICKQEFTQENLLKLIV
jgi:hypothetical protein